MPTSLLQRLAWLPARFDPGLPYLAGCSGGRDSVVMLDILVRHGFRRIVVCHLDHRLRGPASAEDARFVAALADRLGLEYERAGRDVRALATRRHRSIETAGRDARLAFFGEVARRRDCPRIFLGHHADDQVETVLMRLFRGSGLRGLGGMAVESSSENGLTLLRPLLDCWREDIHSHARAHGLTWCEDVTNAGSDPVRNRIRNELIPATNHALGRDVREAVWRAAEIIRTDDEWIEEYARGAWPRVDDGDGLRVPALLREPIAIRRRLVRRWLEALKIPNTGFVDVIALLRLIEPGCRSSRVNLDGGWRARRRGGRLFIDRQSPDGR